MTNLVEQYVTEAIDYRKLKKQWVEAGEAPSWVSTNAVQFFSQKYSYQKESWKKRVEAVCRYLADNAPNVYPDWWEEDEYTKGLTYYDVFFKLRWDGFTIDSTPLLSNAGLLSERGMTISCSGQTIFNNLANKAFAMGELEQLIKNGHGCAWTIPDWLAEGDLYGDDGNRSDGILPVIEEAMEKVQKTNQGVRRGACAFNVNVEHGDFDKVADFLYKNNHVLNLGWIIKDDFIKKIFAKDKEALRRFGRIVQIRMLTGKGYFLKTDTMNRNKADVFKELALEVYGSNLCCVVGTERVPTNLGHLTVSELHKKAQPLAMFDGEKVVQTTPMTYVKDAETVKITLKNGMTHTVTLDHRVMTQNGVKLASDLVVGDKITIQTKEGVFGKVNDPEQAFLVGHFQGDGCSHKDKTILQLWEDDFDLIPVIESIVETIRCRTNNGYVDREFFGDRFGSRKYTASFGNSRYTQNGVETKTLITNCLDSDVFKKGVVPQFVWEGDKETQWAYVKGLMYTDGTACYSKKSAIAQTEFSSTNLAWLQDLQKLCANLGVTMSIFKSRDAGFSHLPDGKGGYKDYPTQATYKLSSGSMKVAKLMEKETQVFSRKGVKLPLTNGYKIRDYSEVVSIEDTGVQPTYCVEVDSEEHLWVCNGVVTHNCELNLPAHEELTFSCPIINTNLTLYRSFPKHIHWLTMIMQDANVTGYLKQIQQKKGKSRLFLDKIHRFTEEFRAVGCGTAGFHSLLMQERIVYGSFESEVLNDQIFSEMQRDTYEASKWLGKVCGVPKGLQKAGICRRNATTMFSPPTKSSAEYSRNTPSEGIGLQTALIKVKEVTGSDIWRIEPAFLSLLKEKGLYTPEMVKDIAQHNGSIQHLDCFTEHEKKVFKTAFEVDMIAHLKMCAGRQPYFDQQQSINIYLSGSDSVEYITEVHLTALALEGINSLYYCYSIRDGQFVREIEECLQCQ